MESDSCHGMTLNAASLFICKYYPYLNDTNPYNVKFPFKAHELKKQASLSEEAEAALLRVQQVDERVQKGDVLF